VDLGLCVASVVFVVIVFNGGREAEICNWIRLFHVARGALCSLYDRKFTLYSAALPSSLKIFQMRGKGVE